MNTCKFCNTSYTGNINTHNRWCQAYKSFIKQCEIICTKEFLIEEYYEKEKSFAAISKELGLSKDRLVKKLFRSYGLLERTEKEWQRASHKMQLRKESYLKKYGVEEMLSSPEVQKQIADTVLEKYGVSNVAKVTSVRSKIESTSINRYGSPSSLSNVEVRNKIKNTIKDKYGVSHIQQHAGIRNKRNNTMLARYGVVNPCENKDILEKSLRNRYSTKSSNLLYSTKSQQFFNKIYNLLPTAIQSECYYADKNKEYFFNTGKSFFFVDFVIPKIRYALEYNGDYFHANPSRYDKDYFNKKIKMTAHEIWDRDISRYQTISNMGYKLDIVWESYDSDKEINRIVKNITNRFNQIHTSNQDEID
jgi:hypothetical protein